MFSHLCLKLVSRNSTAIATALALRLQIYQSLARQKVFFLAFPWLLIQILTIILGLDIAH